MEVFFATIFLTAAIIAAAVLGYRAGRNVQSEMENTASWRAQQAIANYQEAARRNYLLRRDEVRWDAWYTSEQTMNRYPAKPQRLAAPVNACQIPNAQQFQQRLASNGQATVKIQRGRVVG